MPSRAYCPKCRDFTVAETVGHCIACGNEKHRKYEYVATDAKPHHTEQKPLDRPEGQLGLGFS